MLIAAATEPGSSSMPNEDWFAATPKVAMVLDGVTAPAALGTGCQHGTPWYVRSLASATLAAYSRSREPDDADLRALLTDAIETVATQHDGGCDLKHPGTPSATIAMVRQSEDALDYLVLADCTIVLDTASELKIVTDDMLSRVVSVEREAAQSAPLGTAEHEQRVRELAAAQRRYCNQPGGYWVAGADANAAAHALVGAVPTRDVHRFALLTDGAARLAAPFGLLHWSSLLDMLANTGPAALIRQTRRAEAEDPSGARWPRYKQSDDATALYGRVS